MGWMVDESAYSRQGKRFIFYSRHPGRLWVPTIFLFNDYRVLYSRVYSGRSV